MKTNTTQSAATPAVATGTATVSSAPQPRASSTTRVAPPQVHEKKYECLECQRPFQNHFQLNRHMR